MFTIDQIKAAHSEVESGADFPKYIQDIKTLGVKSFTTYVSDGRTEYHSVDGNSVQSSAMYGELVITDETNIDEFKDDLAMHQDGQTGYYRFCQDCARSGIEKWVVDLDGMTCIYYDKAGAEILVEEIPMA
ncbi:DUF1398 domain-containing protein [Mucilaginibacter sp. E4BP6]|uniref:DUF1398 domain-containing protein n=1 Tax=Mucilaginibacter sp. E4BP6 TaxID=2723089 RepID=UPI0015CC45EA|nr:DUF1398 family protein [Mucilaginibacter sp. E4BP6]NYE67404.1 uncharacterized protein YbcV (DUF1398 family) [Mucilaginibacter sp. E4BP6]